MSTGINRLTTERNERVLLDLASKPGNDVCADCKARNPRWGSHNLGIFICTGCASIHRKIGTHVSKVKSLTMDSWTKEQVDRMKEMGNIKSNSFYNQNETRNPPPPTLEDPTRDSELEQYIRSKYEHRRFVNRGSLVESKLGPSRSFSSLSQTTSSVSTPFTAPTTTSPPKTATDFAANMFSTTKPQLQPRATPLRAPASAVSNASSLPPTRSVSQPVLSQINTQTGASTTTKPKAEGVWADLISLQEPATNSSLPLQYQASNHSYSGFQMSHSTPGNLSNMGNAQYGAGLQPSGLPLNTTNQNTFPQHQIQSLNTFPQQTMSMPGFSASTSFQANNMIPFQQNYNQMNSYQQQQQNQSATPFYHPQPQQSLPTSQSQSQFLSSPSTPNPQFMSSGTPQPQSTTPNHQQPGYGNMGMGGGYLTPSPQLMGGVTNQQMMGMQQNPNQFQGAGFPQQQQPVMMGSNPYGQMQFAQGQPFTGQTGPQWGPI